MPYVPSPEAVPSVLSRKVLGNNVFEHAVCQQELQPGVLSLKRFEFACARNVLDGELRLPFVGRILTNFILATDLCPGQVVLPFRENCDDLFYREL